METGNNYSLQEIFAEDNKIIIPDLQREYCWPSETSEIDGNDLVTRFIVNLMELDPTSHKMGLIYAYMPINNQIYLCDGQQRITTLYLLVGYLYKGLRKIGYDNVVLLEEAHKILISEYEETLDDREPRLQYAIRESTLLFLRDLVNNYFIGDDAQIELSDWYFKDYDLDPSIINILKAIKVFQKVIPIGQMSKLLEIIMHHIEFMYFDMKSRTYGEEQYVVINTTGKPLTTSENYKPLFMKGLSDEIMIGDRTEMRYYSDQWEDWEAFFWQFRPRNNNNYIVDKAMKEFFKWVYIIEKCDSESIEVLDKNKAFDIFSTVDEQTGVQKNKMLFRIVGGYYAALKCLGDLKKDILEIYNDRTTLGFSFDKLIDGFLQGIIGENKIDYIHIIPLITYIKLSGKKKLDPDFIRTIRFIINRSEDPDVIRNPSYMVVEAVRFVKQMNNYSPLYVAYKNGSNISSTFLNNKEKFKFNVLMEERDRNPLEYDSILTSLENSMWRAECLRLFRGDISQLFVMIGANSEDHSAISSENIDRAVSLLKESMNRCDDLFRRALLTYGDYSIDTSWSYSVEAQKAQFVNSVDGIRTQYLSTDKKIWDGIYVRFMVDMFKSNKNAEAFEESCIDGYKLCDTTGNQIPTNEDIFFYKLIRYESYFSEMRSKTYAYKEENNECRYWLLSGSRGSRYDKEFDYSLDINAMKTN